MPWRKHETTPAAPSPPPLLGVENPMRRTDDDPAYDGTSMNKNELLLLAHPVEGQMSLCHGARRSSFLLSVCSSALRPRYASHSNCLILTKPAHIVPQMVLYSECLQGQGQGQRSTPTSTFVIFQRKSLLLLHG